MDGKVWAASSGDPGAAAHDLDVGLPDAAPKRVVSPVLVGRDAELATLVSAVLAPPAVVAVEGEAGVGKTRLIAELLAHPGVAERHCLGGRCRRIRESFPLGPMIEAVLGLGDELRDLELNPVAGALRPLLPELAEVLPPTPEPLDDRVAERHRVFRGLINVLDLLGPAVLVLEDLHWADEQTADFLAYLISDSLPAQLAVVITYRTEEAGPGVRALAARPPAGVTGAQVSIPLLDQDRTGALVAAILGTEAVSPEFASYLWERTSGLPLAVEEVLALVRARGLIAHRGGRWERQAIDGLEVPKGIRDPTLERVARLPEPARRVVEAAAVLQDMVPLAVLRAMFGRTADVEGYDAAVGSGLLVERSGTVGFRHLLAAQAVYAELGGARRRRLHGQAAEALRIVGAVPRGQVAHHLEHAGRLEEWAGAAEAAADHAVELANEEEAIRLLDRVLRTAPLEPDRRGRLAVKLGRTAIDTMRSREVVDLLSQALEQDVPWPVRGELRLELARVLNQCGDDVPAQRELLAGAVDDLDHRSDLRAHAIVALVMLSPPDLPLSQDLARLHQAVQLVGEIEDEQLAIFVLGKVGMMLLVFGDLSWRSLVDRVIAVTGGSPRRRQEVNAYSSLGTAACWAGHHDIGERMLDSGLDATATRENKRLAIRLRSGKAVLAYRRGAWDGLADDVVTLIDEYSGFPLDGGLDVQLVAGCLTLARGEVDDARRRLSHVLGEAVRLAQPETLPTATAAAARLALLRGDLEDAQRSVRLGMTALDTKGLWAPIGRLLPTAVEVLVAAGRQAEVTDLVDRAERELRGLDAPLAPAALRYARGVLASSSEDFLAAAELYESVGTPYEAAQASERAAACLVAEGDARSATSSLRSAVKTYERLGASWDRNRAASLARRYGLSLPAVHRGGHRGYGTRLSPRERQVAVLAAAGRTNTEIASELFVSKNTVDKQLAAAMRKLKVRSRMDLARALDQSNGRDDVSP